MDNPIVKARAEFNSHVAPGLARQLGANVREDGPSDRFAWFGDRERLVIVSGATEIAHRGVDLALAYGLHERGTRSLTLVLPAGGEFSTLQRAAWLKESTGVAVWTHDGAAAARSKVPTQQKSIANVTAHLKGISPTEDMRRASTPKYLKDAAKPLEELAAWLNSHEHLDSGHRRGERSWQCMGQRVLSIKSHAGGLRIRAGIHESDIEGWTDLPLDGYLTPQRLSGLKRRVDAGIEQRLRPGAKYNKPDEHWLQAVIRKKPSILGLEHPVLREVPAWRPLGTPEKWSRAFVDIIGVDGLGDIKVAETKLSTNADDLLVMQGLDYFIWARAYKEWLADRLFTSKLVANPSVEFVIGSTTQGDIHLSHRAKSNADALNVPWRFRTVQNWFSAGPDEVPAAAVLLPVGGVPE